MSRLFSQPQCIRSGNDPNSPCVLTMPSPRSAKIEAFTLIELVVGLSIISIVVALGLPALLSSRERARVASCLNHSRQIGLASQGHLAAHRVYPSNGGYESQDTIEPAIGVVPSTLDFDVGYTIRWGTGKYGIAPHDQPGSFFYSLLPYLDQPYMTVGVGSAQIIDSFQCPSRYRGESALAADDQRGQYRGGALAWAKVDWAANAHIVHPRPICSRPSLIEAGLSNTILFGEKYHDSFVQTASSWFYDEPYWIGGSNGTVRMLAVLGRDESLDKVNHGWGAAHVTSATFGIADGSVTRLTFEVDEQILKDLLSIR